MIRAACPNDPLHRRFITVVHVLQDWVVDEHGVLLCVSGDPEVAQVINPSDITNEWTCAVCGELAIVTDTEW